MKFVTFLFLFSSVLSSTYANELKSSKLRAKICEQIVEFLEFDEGIPMSFQPYWKNKIEVFPSLMTTCKKSTNSFSVKESFYSDKAKATTSLTVDINFELKNFVKVTGSTLLKRPAFNPDTGEVEIGQWKLMNNKFSYNLQSKAILRLAELIVFSSNIHNGGANLIKFDPSTYSMENEISKLNKNIMSNDEYNNESCKMAKVDSGAEWMFLEAEGYSSYQNQAKNAFNILKKQDFILNTLGSESEEWTEYCAFYDVYIYLKDGSLIVINYDFTT